MLAVTMVCLGGWNVSFSQVPPIKLLLIVMLGTPKDFSLHHHQLKFLVWENIRKDRKSVV